MSFFSDLVFNAKTQRHELQFVNQQYDYLMGIAWNERLGDYALDETPEEARAIARTWGRDDFDLAHWLEIARTQLPKRDRERLDAPSPGG